MSDHSDSDHETVERTIKAPPEKIFELVADPAHHKEIDGSGTVVGTKGTPTGRLSLGSKFGRSMKLGIPYSMESEVIEFEEGRKIAWQTRPPGIFHNLGGGRIWRYELEPVDGGTLVRETWDISQEKIKALVRPARKKTHDAMEKTLARIDEIVTGSTPAP
jgi:uncharacterized protein YndB with AHSA1/START domain